MSWELHCPRCHRSSLDGRADDPYGDRCGVCGQFPANELSADEFERAYAERSGVTVEWLREHGRVVIPCSCGDDICEGWQSVPREIAAELLSELLSDLDETACEIHAALELHTAERRRDCETHRASRTTRKGGDQRHES